MADTVVKTKSTKVTKKDLEAEIAELGGVVESLRGARQALIEQSDSYWESMMRQEESLRRIQRELEGRDHELGEYKQACDLGDEALRGLMDTCEALQRRLNMREAQLNFNLRVMQSILAYGGENLSVIRGLVNSVLSECDEREGV